MKPEQSLWGGRELPPLLKLGNCASWQNRTCICHDILFNGMYSILIFFELEEIGNVENLLLVMCVVGIFMTFTKSAKSVCQPRVHLAG